MNEKDAWVRGSRGVNRPLGSEEDLRERGQWFGRCGLRSTRGVSGRWAMSSEGNVGSYSTKPAFQLGHCHVTKDHITPSRQPAQRPEDMLAREPVLNATGTETFFLLLHSFINIATLNCQLS